MRRLWCSLVVAVSVLLGAGAVWSAQYEIDTAHSSLGFAVKHMMVSTTTGTFDDYQGAIAYDPNDVAAFKADITIQAKSINTRQSKRDEHLRTADFFDTEKFPTITFAGKKLTKEGDKAVMTGDLTMKGVTKEVSIPVEISGPVNGMMGPIIGISGSFTLNRQDYGIQYNKALDNGGLALSNDVRVDINIEALQKK